MKRVIVAVAALLAVGLLAGCGGQPSVANTTVVQTVTHTAPRSTPAPPPPTGAVDVGPVATKDGACPYIDKQTAADLEGNRIGRIVVLSQRGQPIGCQFFFDPNWGYPRMTMEIRSATYHTPTDAYNAMVRTGQAGGNPHAIKALVPGVDAMVYQTAFYQPDGTSDWACTFAKGMKVVTVKTDQNDTSQDARNVAAAVAPKF